MLKLETIGPNYRSLVFSFINMLYLLWGKDTIKSKGRLKELKNLWQKKYPDLPILVFDEDNFSLEEIQNLAKSGSLFYEKQLIVLNRLLENEEIAPLIVKEFPQFKVSRNVFLFWEEDIEAGALKLFEENGARAELFPLKKAEEKFKKDRIFYQLTDALFEKKKRLALRFFYQMLASGVLAEDIFWHLWWALKNIALVSIYKNEGAKEIEKKTGLNPFVVQKCLEASRLISQEKIETSLKEAVLNYNYSRLGFREMDKELELLFLKF